MRPFCEKQRKNEKGVRYMGKEFKRLKRYNATWTAIRSVSVGISLALLLAGVLLALTKLHIMEAKWLHYVLCAAIGLGVQLLYALLQRRSELRIAEKIDAEHKLLERVQTMVQYQQEDSAMLQVQREDTEQRLQAVRGFGQRKLTLAAHFVLVVVAVAVFAAGAIMPAQAVVEPPAPTEPPYEVTEWQKAAVAELIKHVQKSDMASAAKDPTVTQLQELLLALDTKMTAGILKERVVAVMENTYRVTDEVNSNDDIYDVIVNHVDHKQAPMLAYAMGALQNVERDDQIETIRAAMEKEEGLVTAGELADGLKQALEASVFDEMDPLYAAVAALTEKLQKVADAMAAEDLTAARNALGVAFGELKVSANAAMEQQDLTKEECVYVVDTLCTVFGITGADRPDDPDSEMFLKNEDDEYKPNEGGYGTGDLEVAGDDEIYDYREHAFTAYGELLESFYYNEALQQMENMSEEIRQIVEKYFNELWTGEEEN